MDTKATYEELEQTVKQLEKEVVKHRRTEEALRESEQKLAGIIDSITDCMFMMDEQHTIVWTNDVARGLFGSDLVGKKCYSAYQGRDTLCEPCIVKKCFNDGRTHEFETEAIPSDGHKRAFWSTASVAAWYENGRPKTVVKILRDVTERKKLEAQFFQAQKMEAVGRLAGGIAHDFNNLLQTINGYSILVLRSLGDGDPLREDIEEILSAGREAAALTDHLLEFSREQKSQIRPVDLNAVIVGKEKMLRRLIGEDIKIVTKLADRLSLVKGDPGQIRQVIMNLVVNAHDAMPEGGTLTITTENVTLDHTHCKLVPGARPGTFVCLSISDTGIGIEEAKLDRIFEPFYTTKGPGEGTGLGLSTVYCIIRQHKGFTYVSSSPGKGATFSIYLPVSSIEREDETRDSISLRDVQGNGERILLVEDERRVRNFVTRALRENGYIPFPASSGTEALTIFEKEDGRFHLVLSDVVLPDTNGPKLVDQLLALKPDLRIILASGYTGRKAQRSLIQERGYVFLQKPYELADLLKAMREVLGTRD